MFYMLKRLVRGEKRYPVIKTRAHHTTERTSFRMPPRGGQAHGRYHPPRS